MRLDNSCPFCGDDAQVATISLLSARTGTQQFAVVCHNCTARGPARDSLHDAIDAWSMRTPKPIWKRLEDESKEVQSE